MAGNSRSRTIDVLVDRIASNSKSLAQIKAGPIKTLTTVGQSIKA